MNTYIWNLESSTDEPTYRATVEMHREQTQKHGGAGLRGRGREYNRNIYTKICKIDSQWEYAL